VTTLPARFDISLSLCACLFAMALVAAAPSAAQTPAPAAPATSSTPAAKPAPKQGALDTRSEPKGQRKRAVNPASRNCLNEGGNLTIEKDGAGAQFGICNFEDNKQCEEWAMMRTLCPTGGIKVTGYVTPAARYCAITGGTYAATANSNKPDERGSCTFKNSKSCDATDYFNQKCQRGEGGSADRAPPKHVANSPTNTIAALFTCNAGKAFNAVFVNKEPASVKLTLSDGRNLTLPQAASGSGARYASEGDKIVFWNKGNTGFIEEAGKQTYANCATKAK
jgi:putative hemolysin/membrane-bound inhibitor of C-type lysozyme